MPLRHLMWSALMWKSTSSNGCEYFDCVRGLGFESYLCQLCDVCFIIFLYIICEGQVGDNVILYLCSLSQSVNWFVGCGLTLYCEGMGSNPSNLTSTLFLLLNSGLWYECGRVEET